MAHPKKSRRGPQPCIVHGAPSPGTFPEFVRCYFFGAAGEEAAAPVLGAVWVAAGSEAFLFFFTFFTRFFATGAGVLFALSFAGACGACAASESPARESDSPKTRAVIFVMMFFPISFRV
jgi:hypothetical protein